MRDVTFQLAEVAVPRILFQTFLGLTDDPRPRPAPAWAGGAHFPWRPTRSLISANVGLIWEISDKADLI